MSLKKSIHSAFDLMHERGWDKIYVAVDLHGTIIVPGRNIPFKPYERAAECLSYLSHRKDVSLILYTGTPASMLSEVQLWCMNNDISFKFINENPECTSSFGSDFSNKMYYNLLLDDRAGFDPETDWEELLDTFKKF